METKTILITGANRGIGLEIARQLSHRGHRLVLAGRSAGKLRDAAASLKGVETAVLEMDTGHAGSIFKSAATFAGLKWKLDVLINNAAVLHKADRSILDETYLENTLAVNSLGPLRVVAAFLEFFREPGRIINISSGGGSMTDPVGGWSPAYCVSKSLLNAITRQLAAELEDRISVNAVCPGWVRTDMGGRGAPRSVERGAETPVWLALDAPLAATGKFFRDKKEIPW